MTSPALLALLPEWTLLAGSLALFAISLGDSKGTQARTAALATAAATLLAALLSLGREATLFDAAYRVDAFSQWLKVLFAVGFGMVLLLGGGLPDIRAEVRSEYHLMLTLSVCGLVFLVSAVEVITLLVALELSAFPLYFLIAMRREREGQRAQMESVVKYMMFGVAANGFMLFGLSYLFGITGTTSLPVMVGRLQGAMGSPLAMVGLAMTFCGFYYKLAVFPFHFWTPDVYQGASNETAGVVASLPKLGAVAVLVRFTSMVAPGQTSMAWLVTGLAVASMFYGNLIALWQTDLKRLLGFSSIAHAGYALIGFVTLDREGYAAALFYMAAYLFMVLACFLVVCRVSPEGANVPLVELGGLHRRAPLLAATLGVGVFGLAGVPPFAGFTGKLTLLTTALAKGYVVLVVIAVVNTAIAIYYYLGLVREAFFSDAGERPPIRLDGATRALCVGLIAGIVLLGVAPARVLDAISSSLAFADPRTGYPPTAWVSPASVPAAQAPLRAADLPPPRSRGSDSPH